MRIIKLLIISLISNYCIACSMYKVTADGRTIVGNNEDWISPNSKFWFEPGNGENYGIMYMGLLNNFPQGGINEAGLVFDGFANPYLEITDTEGKLPIPIPVAVHHAMQSFSSVEEVKTYLTSIHLGSLASSQIVFVDRSGTYLIVEGDELIIGDESEKIFSNFYYSQVSSISDVTLENVKNGITYTSSSKALPTLDYCASVMKSLRNPENLTQYSTIYDLEKLTIRVHLYHDFSESVEIDLKKELSKDQYEVMIADLFPEQSKGLAHYHIYNDVEDPTSFVREWTKGITEEQELIRKGFAFNINWIGYEWLNDKNDAASAIQIFQYATEIMPTVANLYDSLGEAYFKNDEFDLATASYKRSLELDPENENAISMLKRIKKATSR